MTQPGEPYVSLWLEEALAEEQSPAADSGLLPHRAEVVIVGGGFTGLWTAIRLLERKPELDVCLLEQHYCGYGPSGRNGGIADSSWAKFPVMVRLYGEAEAIRLAKAVDAGLEELEGYCLDHQITADIRRKGNLWGATNRAQVGSWLGAHEALGRAGLHPFRIVDAGESQELSSSPRMLGGVFESNTATVQPAKLVRGLRRVAASLGARIYEGTTVSDQEGTRPVVVHTDHGDVLADKVVLATNAWAASHPALKPFLFVTSSDIVATARMPERLPEGLASGIALADSRRLILYWRSTPDGRVVFGKGGGWMSSGNRVDRRFTGESGFAPHVQDHFGRLYPDLSSAAFEYSWNGPIDYSTTGLPYFGPLRDDNPNVLVGVGYSGNGIVPTMLGGRILASLVLESKDEYSSLPVTRRWERRLPPDPFRSLGAPIVKSAVARKERLLDADRTPDPFLEFMAALDPTRAPTQA